MSVAEDVIETCRFGCGWRHVGEWDEALYERRLHEEKEHADESLPGLVSAHDLVKTVLCEAEGCEVDADVAGFCFFHSRNPTEPRPDSSQDANVIAARVVAEFVGEKTGVPLCRHAGCESQSIGAVAGPFANLCSVHTEEARAERAEASRVAAVKSWGSGYRPKQGSGWIKVPGTGLQYRSTMEMYAAADEIETSGERVAENARFDGDEAKAEKAADQSRALAEKIRQRARAIDGETEPDPAPVAATSDLLPGLVKVDEAKKAGPVQELEAAVEDAQRAARRLRTAQACFQEFANELSERANGLLRQES